MGTRTVRLDDDVYERIERRKRPNETVSEAIDRLIRTPSLAELGSITDGERIKEMEEAIEAADEADAAEVEAFLKELESE